MPKKLYSASELAYILGMSRQSLDQAVQEKRIEENDYVTKNVRGWTASQVERIRKYYKRRDG